VQRVLIIRAGTRPSSVTYSRVSVYLHLGRHVMIFIYSPFELTV
jgi:hypothetical protein